MLALSEIEDGHDGGLLVLRRVALEDLGDELLILGVELERDVGVVVRRVAVLQASSVSRPGCSQIHPLASHIGRASEGCELGQQWLTTWSVSLWRREVQDMARVWTGRGLAARGAALTAVRRRNGVNLLAIAAIECDNGRASFGLVIDQVLDG